MRAGNIMGQNIRNLRVANNLTQAQLAEKIGISDTYLGSIERGERGARLDTLEAIADYFNITVDALINDIDGSDGDLIEEFRALLRGIPDNRKRMVMDVIRTMVKHLNDE